MTDQANDEKRRVARAALAELPDAGIIGLGSGSTAELFIEEVGLLVRAGRKLVGVPTSQASRALATRAGIPLLDDAGPWDIAVNVDGADEVDAALCLIKGGGAAHTREKIVNEAARVNVIVVDASKMSTRLGEKRAVPIEVLPFGHGATALRLTAFGRAALRMRGEEPLRTDAGNYLYDITTGPVADVRGMDAALRGIPGAVETGLFVGRAHVVLVARGPNVERLVP